MLTLKRYLITSCALGFFTLLLSSCASVIKPQPNELDFAAQPKVWSSYLQSSEVFSTSADSQWWNGFDDPVLTRLIEQAVGENIDIELARERVREARILASLELTAFQPDVSARGSVSDQSQSETAVLPVGRIPNFEPDNSIYSAGFDASWEIDLFGRKEAVADIGELNIQSAEELQRDITLSIVAEIARGYFNLLAAQIEKISIDASITHQQKLIELMQQKREYGEASDSDIELSKVVLNEYETALSEVLGRIHRHQVSLAALTGKPPTTRLVNDVEKSILPPGPTTATLGLTSDVLRRRPDVRRAERDYVLAARRVDLSKISTYPSFSLFGSVGPETTDLGDLLDSRSIASTLSALLEWSLYDGGRDERELDADKSRLRQAELNYSQSVVTALEDVEIAAANYITASQTSTKREAIVSSRDRLSDIARERYEAGTGTLLDVLIAERTLGDATIDFVKADAQRLASLISLYKALGGGWEAFETLNPAETASLSR